MGLWQNGAQRNMYVELSSRSAAVVADLKQPKSFTIALLYHASRPPGPAWLAGMAKLLVRIA